jgi:competence protein ComEA
MNTDNGAVEVNRATVEELTAVPGIGPALAERIVAARPFTSLEDLTRVSGIGPTSLEKIRPFLKIDFAAAPEAEEPASTPDELVSAAAADQQPAEAELPLPESPSPEAPPVEAESVQIEEGKAQTESQEAAPADAETPAPVESQPASAPPPAAQTLKSGEKWARREDLLWTGVGVAILTLILSLIFTLGTLALINQTLTYAPAAEAQALSARLDALNNRIRLLEGDVDNLRSRVQTIEALGGRVTTLERGQQSLSEELKSAQSELADLQQQTAAFQTQIEELQKRSNVFQNFLDGLRRLLSVGETP